MSDIEVVIKIPKEKYNKLVMEEDHIRACGSYYPVMILDGIPLPKGHGDLKDNDTLDTIFLNATNSPNKKLSYEEISNLILDAPTIIEADREESEEYANEWIGYSR